MDDGSSDSSRDILNDFARRDPRFRIIAQKNGGASRARNVALEQAIGKWIVFCDSDDYMPNDLLENFNRQLSEDSHLDGIVYRPEQVDENGTSISRQCNHSFVKTFEAPRIVSGIMRIPDMWCAIGGPWAKVYRREIVERFHIRFLDPFSVAEDALFNAEYYSCCRFVKVDYRVTGHNYRIFAGGLSRTGDEERKTLDQLRIVEAGGNFAREWRKRDVLRFVARKGLMLVRLGVKRRYGRTYWKKLVYSQSFRTDLLLSIVQAGPLWVVPIAAIMLVMPRVMIYCGMWMVTAGLAKIK